MQKPEVRIIDQQQESTNTDVDISQSEAEYLLYKYGFKKEITQTHAPINNQSFEDMIRQQENQQKKIEGDKDRRVNGPNPITFDGRNVNYTETKWADMELDNNNTLGIKIQIVTDMKIN